MHKKSTWLLVFVNIGIGQSHARIRSRDLKMERVPYFSR